MPRKKKPLLLSLVLQSLVGQPLCLEMKNDDEIHGAVEAVDRDMNISLVDTVHVYAKSGLRHKATFTLVMGSSIRFVHIPAKVNVSLALRQQMLARKMARQKSQRRRPRKESIKS